MIGSAAVKLKVMEETSLSSRRIISWSDLVEEQMSKRGLSLLQAVEKIRALIDNGLLIPIEESALILLRLHKQTSEFERRQQRLQESWLKAREMDSLQVFREEARALNNKREEKCLTK